jgi:biotin-(acetyl-CoA carboxylase) ligase
MTLKKGPRMRERYARALSLPPPFALVALREAGDAFAHACVHAQELGAGTLVMVGRFDLAEFAVVLEPDEPLASARRAFYAGMVAVADTLAGLAPPETPMSIEWPDAILVDAGLVGGGRLGWPEGAREEDAPDWLVFGAVIRTSAAGEPGLHARATALAEEGFAQASAGRVVEGFARHLMVALDRWRAEGFAPVAQQYISRLARESGTLHSMAETGDLETRRARGVAEHHNLAQALRWPSWLDPATREPRL